MASKVFLIGMIGGLAVALGLAAVFSAIATQSTAQMMQHNSGMTGTQMMINPSMMSMQAPWQWNNKATFSANGMSNVENVQITGISITGERDVTVNLRYHGNGTTPSVTVIALTNPMPMMGMMHGSSGMGMMDGSMMNRPGITSNNSWNATATSIPFTAFQSQTGSSVMNAGWTSETTLKVRIDGDGSAYDINGIHVMVFPLTS